MEPKNFQNKSIKPEYLLATWGANARQEATDNSDIDLICLAPTFTRDEIISREKEIVSSVPYRGAYLDLLICDMTHQPLGEWAKRNATDYQAILFSNDPQGPKKLIRVFEKEKQKLWNDLPTRAREVWHIISQTILHPRVSGQSLFRPEKYSIGATRSWVTIAEIYALMHGWSSRFITTDVLRTVEKLLGLIPDELVRSYLLARELRARIERKECSFKDCAKEYSQLNRAFTETAYRLLDAHLSWLQHHAGVEPELLSNLFETLFEQKPLNPIPLPTSIHFPTQIMVKVITAKNDFQIRQALVANNDDWFPRSAVTTNPYASAETLHQIAFPKHNIDWWTNRNIRLWAMRHPNVARKSANKLIATTGLRKMDYEAANVVLSRIISK